VREPLDIAPGGPELARAEELIDRGAQSVATWASRIGREVLKGAARAREEAEDILAEARSLADSPPS
jgi:hypothetical protein